MLLVTFANYRYAQRTMSIGEITILAFVQGLTEFLPVSSSGHLLLARFLFGIADTQGQMVDAFLHLGTLGAVLVYYRRTWWQLLRGLFGQGSDVPAQRRLACYLFVATIPGALVGYFGEDFMATHWRSTHAVAWQLLATAAVLWWFDRATKLSKEMPALTGNDAAIIGSAQIAALIPGVSRSAVTIAAGRARGLSRSAATTFSFLMSAPIIAGAGVVGLSSLVHDAALPTGQLLLGTLVSFVSGLVAIAGLMHLIQRVSFRPFVVYLVVVAAMLFIYAQ